jgi:hypothetical protein
MNRPFAAVAFAATPARNTRYTRVNPGVTENINNMNAVTPVTPATPKIGVLTQQQPATRSAVILYESRTTQLK